MFGSSRSILGMFTKQIIYILFALACFIIAYFFILEIGISKGLFVSANEPILQSEEYSERISNGEQIRDMGISDSIDYVLVDHATNKTLETNISERKLQKYRQANYDHNFLKIEDNKTTMYIYNSLKSQFSKPSLRHLFPNIEFIILIITLLLFLLVTYFIAKNFQKKLKRENEQLIDITNQIEAKNLDIVLPDNQIKEYQSVYRALEHLAWELSQMIKKNIQLQQEKEEQISFLVHDLKIPLTVIKGNTEILSEKELSDHNSESFEDIDSAVREIEQYIQQIIDLNLNTSVGSENEIEQIAVKDIASYISTSGLFPKQRVSIQEINVANEKIKIQKDNFLRAISNIVMNAAERTPSDKKVELIIKVDNQLTLTVNDHGEGFSEESLEKAKDLFYTENKARINNQHYGLGLSISTRIIESFGGSIELFNTNLNGGRVIVSLPICE